MDMIVQFCHNLQHSRFLNYLKHLSKWLLFQDHCHCNKNCKDLMAVHMLLILANVEIHNQFKVTIIKLDFHILHYNILEI